MYRFFLRAELKLVRVGADFVAGGRLFHSLIVLGKNECRWECTEEGGTK